MNRNLVFTIVAALVLICSCSSTKSTSAVQLQNVSIHTSGQCEMCITKIESRVGSIPGVKSAKLDMKTYNLNVSYNPEKSTPEKIKKVIVDLGYDADELKANEEAYKKLPACCKKK